MFSKVRSYLPAIVSVVGLTLGASSAHASMFYYADWTAATLNSAIDGSGAGTITTPQGVVSVNYSGDVSTWTLINNMGPDFYTAFPSVYTNATVSNSPTNVDVITLWQSRRFTNTLLFLAPVVNPILDLVSLGQISVPVSYNFNATPVILSQGSAAYGGCATCLTVTGNTLTGTEGDGVVQFLGTFSQLSWTTTGAEIWNGFTVGVADLQGDAIDPLTPSPEPATWTAFAIAALAAFVRMKTGRSTAQSEDC